MHYFIRDKMATYDESNFSVPSGIKGKFPRFFDQGLLLDNLTWYESNKCGLTHGLLDTSWNIAGLGPTVHCNFFAKTANQIGTDLRSFDFQYGREVGESSYLSYLQTFQKLNVACDRNITANDISKMESGTLSFLSKRYQNKLWEIGLTIALDFENRDGILGKVDSISNMIMLTDVLLFLSGPGVQFFIKDQLDRTICGDRFWYNHANGIFTKSKF